MTPSGDARIRNVAFIGNPNTGKSTIFSALSGVHARIGNFPGVTVEKKTSRASWDGQEFQLIDLPGTYSLSPRSGDEMVAVDVLLGRVADVGPIDLVVCIVDSTNLERNFYLLSQLLDMELPVVLVLNMWDSANARGVSVDLEALRSRLGIPVVTTTGHRRIGIDELKKTILEHSARPGIKAPKVFPEVFYEQRDVLSNRLETAGVKVPPYLVERLILDVGGYTESKLGKNESAHAELASIRDYLRDNQCAVPVIEARSRYDWARETLTGITKRPTKSDADSSYVLDKVFTHRLLGLLVFCSLMFIVFQAIYYWASGPMVFIENLQGYLSGFAEGLMSPGPFRSLLVDGVIAGVGSVLVFLPQIAFLFLFIAILEDCGYMARAAFLMDRLMTKLGLSGKSFVPLMSSFACAIPGIMATRTIENRRDRMVTILVAPLMSCSARLPVYILLMGAFVPKETYLNGWLELHGIVLFAMYCVGAIAAVGVAWILKRFVFPGETAPFVMELPPYKWPSPTIVLSRVYDRCGAFVMRAGSLIFMTTVVVWAAGTFPGDRGELYAIQQQIEELESTSSQTEQDHPALDELKLERNVVAANLLENSFLGMLGKKIEPIVEPLGWDWKIGVGAIASFPAREVIISTLGTIYSLGGDVDEEHEGLMGAMKSSKNADGLPVFNLAVALSVMVFFALCAQCGATLMVIKRETNSWWWPLVTFVYMTVLAYIAAFITYRIFIGIS